MDGFCREHIASSADKIGSMHKGPQSADPEDLFFFASYCALLFLGLESSTQRSQLSPLLLLALVPLMAFDSSSCSN